MTNPIFSTLRGAFRSASQWFQGTPERALDDAYEAAMRIKVIEDNYFGGGRITADYGTYGSSTHAYFQSELRKHLNTARTRLAVFQTSNTVLRATPRSVTEVALESPTDETYNVNIIDKPALIFRKLTAIDEVLARYGASSRSPSSGLVVVPGATTPDSNTNRKTGNALRGGKAERPNTQQSISKFRPDDAMDGIESFADRTGVLPRSILRTAERIKRDLDPSSEQEVMDNYRMSRARTSIALRLVLLLIILPLLTQQVAKSFVVGPVIDRIRTQERVGAFLNMDMEQEAFQDLRRFEEISRFEQLIGKAPRLSEPEMQEQFQEKVLEIREVYHQRSNDAVKNVFADLMAMGMFGIVLAASKREVEVLKSFIDEVVYGLSDSAKAFVIILFTDIFVGFHSPHGWEVLLEGISQHFGLAADREFIFLFIATFPVILDTIFKYWIFRYLNRISPSAVATYRNMNE